MIAKKVPDVVGEEIKRGPALLLAKPSPGHTHGINEGRVSLDEPGVSEKVDAAETPQPAGEGPEVCADPGEQRKEPESPVARSGPGAQPRGGSGARQGAASGIKRSRRRGARRKVAAPHPATRRRGVPKWGGQSVGAGGAGESAAGAAEKARGEAALPLMGRRQGHQRE